jgi:hypothetical protein
MEKAERSPYAANIVTTTEGFFSSATARRENVHASISVTDMRFSNGASRTSPRTTGSRVCFDVSPFLRSK